MCRNRVVEISGVEVFLPMYRISGVEICGVEFCQMFSYYGSLSLVD